MKFNEIFIYKSLSSNMNRIDRLTDLIKNK